MMMMMLMRTMAMVGKISKLNFGLFTRQLFYGMQCNSIMFNYVAMYVYAMMAMARVGALFMCIGILVVLSCTLTC